MTLYCGTHNWLCVQKMLTHGLNHVFFLSLFKLISSPYIALYVLAYLNLSAVLVLPKPAGSAQTHKIMSFIWNIWSTLYVYLWLPPKSLYRMDSCEFFLKNTTDQKASQSIRLQNSDNYLTIKWQLMKNQNVEVWC